METEHNPTRYFELLKPQSRPDVDAAIKAFYADVMAARIAHKIADVHIIVRVRIAVDSGNDAPAFSSAHLGATQEAEGMCAWAFARSAEERRAFIDECKLIGAASTRGA